MKINLSMTRLHLLALSLGAFSMASHAVPLDEFVKEGLKGNLLLKEKQFKAEITKHELSKGNNEAILPKLRVTMAFGPAPGIREGIDTLRIDGVDFYEKYENYDFSRLGTYFGFEAEFNQPLNFGRLHMGNRALKANHQVTLAEVQKGTIELNTDLQKLYYGYQLAHSTRDLALNVRKELKKAIRTIEDKLDEGEEDVSQLDLLKLKSNLFEVEDGLFETEEGIKRAKANIRFLFENEDPLSIMGADSLITKHPANVPSLEVLEAKLLEIHPDLKRIKFGLVALDQMAQLQEADLGPEFFLFGKFQFTKSWARDRLAQERSVFSQDPLNTLEGALGIGARFDLNFWNTHHKAVTARMKHRDLEHKNSYASEGLLLKLREAYFLVERHKDRMNSAEKSLNASDAWLKGAAMQYDLDPSLVSELLSAFSKNASLQKDYYFTLYDYNLAVAKLMEVTGLSLEDFLKL